MTPLTLLPRFRAARLAMSGLAQSESWSRDRLDQHQLTRLNALWAHAIEHVPHYRAIAASRDLPRQFDDLAHFTQSVPLLEKHTIREDARPFLSERCRPGRWHKTSGSTGMPMRFYASHQAHQAMLRCQYRFRQMWGVEMLDPLAVLMGTPAAAATFNLSTGITRARAAAADRLRRRLRLPVHRMSPGDLREHLQKIARFRPCGVYGFSRALQLLAREAQAAGWRCPSLKVAILTSEPAFPALRAEVERGLGVPAAVEYGATECGLIACEWPDRTLRVREDHVLLETLPRSEGRWDIVITVLSNPDFPLIRYRIEDLTDAPLVRPPRGFAVMGAIAGRNDDWLVTQAGQWVHPAEVDAVFEEFRSAAIRRYRVHQHADGGLDVSVEFADGGNETDLSAIRQKLGRVVEGCAVHVRRAEAIEQTLTGKHRLVTSERSRVG